MPGYGWSQIDNFQIWVGSGVPGPISMIGLDMGGLGRGGLDMGGLTSHPKRLPLKHICRV